MSRLIVKNLPNGMKEERFRQLFASFGALTDCSLKFTKDGKFRKFGFIGFKSEEEARSALNHFNRSFIDTSRIVVEFCKSFGDPTKPRAWSKHAQKTSQSKNPSKGQDSVSTEPKKDDKTKKVASELEKLKKDAEFREFLSVHQKRTQTATWANDALDAEPSKGKGRPASDYLNFDSDSGQESDEEGPGEDPEEEGGREPRAAVQQELSDMDYLKSKMVTSESLSSSEEEGSEDEAVSCADGSEAVRQDGAGRAAGPEQDAPSRDKRPGAAGAEADKPATQKEPTTPHTVRLRGAPFNVTEVGADNVTRGRSPWESRGWGHSLVKTSEKDELVNTQGFVIHTVPVMTAQPAVATQRPPSTIGTQIGMAVRQKNLTDKNGLPAAFGLQAGHIVDGHKLEVRISERATKPALTSARKKQVPRKQTTSKILVRNIPFQADSREIRELFSTFGELKTVRLPKKMSGTGSHRGFGFVDFLTKQDAKRAFHALCHSTHLYGRRLVLEWADSEVSLPALRRKTAERFHEPPKKKRSVMLDEILEQLEDSENDSEERTLQLRAGTERLKITQACPDERAENYAVKEKGR
uniref:probable RNA-binding protein 19 n=1 Tax=Panthera onca TaxID=9690 RepID=UPI002954C101|nr:probable RNA-binding protein 19 [Panthera onca]